MTDRFNQRHIIMAQTTLGLATAIPGVVFALAIAIALASILAAHAFASSRALAPADFAGVEQLQAWIDTPAVHS